MDTVNWTRELDEVKGCGCLMIFKMIREAVARYGTNDWGKVCQKLRTQHITPEQCQSRWENVLREQTVKVNIFVFLISFRDLGVRKKMLYCVL